MQLKNWARIILCGFVVGVVWYLLSALSLSFIAQDFLATVQEGGPHARWGGAVFFGIDIVMGVWAIWLYSTIAPRYGGGVKAVAIAGLGWWAMKSLQSAKWVGLGFAPVGGVAVALATTLISMVVALGMGAWLFQRVEMPAAKGISAT